MNYRDFRDWENLQKAMFDGEGLYEIPIIKPEHYVDEVQLIDFNQAVKTNSSGGKGKGVHFFIDDYHFVGIWKNIDKYIPILKRFDIVLSPDFSIYTDFPKAIQIYNHYRKHWVGAYLQSKGVTVIPTITWSTPDTFDFCFDGEPKHSTVAVSSVGCMKDDFGRRLFIDGWDEMMKRIEPENVIFYGQMPQEIRGNIIHIAPFADKFKKLKVEGA